MVNIKCSNKNLAVKTISIDLSQFYIYSIKNVSYTLNYDTTLDSIQNLSNWLSPCSNFY